MLPSPVPISCSLWRPGRRQEAKRRRRQGATRRRRAATRMDRCAPPNLESVHERYVPLDLDMLIINLCNSSLSLTLEPILQIQPIQSDSSGSFHCPCTGCEFLGIRVISFQIHQLYICLEVNDFLGGFSMQ